MASSNSARCTKRCSTTSPDGFRPGDAADGRPGSVGLIRGSGIRKATGSFYTPQPIADYLVRRTLGPLVRDASPERILQLRVVDPAMGSGAFLVSACRYLAAAYEAALVRTGAYHGSDFGARERVATRRTIAERCLYGVDLNPMAVQLARLSLWLATLAADRPLTFLDHHLQTGDSLLGAWLSSLRRPPIPDRGRRSRQDAAGALPLFADADVAEALRAALPIRFSLEETPGDTIDQVRAKESALAALGRRDAVLAKWKRVADLWCAVWFTASSGRRAGVVVQRARRPDPHRQRCAATKARGGVSADRRHRRGIAPPVSLGARVSRSVLRRRRREHGRTPASTR